MKNILFSLMFAAVVMLAGSAAMAAVQTYDTRVGKFSIDVPDGWNGKAVSDGCQVDSADSKNAMSIQFIPPNSMTSMDMAQNIAEAIKKKISSEKNEDGNVFLDGEVNGQQMAILIVKDDAMFLVATFDGPDRDKMMSVYGTVKGKD